MPSAAEPAACGYRLPAQWEPHAATWLAWPHNRNTWPGRFDPIPEVFRDLVHTLAQFEPVNILAGGDEVMRQARRMVGTVSGVTLYDVPTNDAWIRDFGPTFLAGPSGSPPALVDWQYNAWGGKYPPFDCDNRAGRRIAEHLGRRRFSPTMVLEGGAIDHNGLGTVLAAEACLLNENRNPGFGRCDAERFLADYLSARKVLWMNTLIAGDDTDGHVDQFVRFVGPSTVVVAREPDPADETHAPLEAAYARLEQMTDQDDRPLERVSLPMPSPIYHEGVRVPANYANFYIANGLVVVPQFDNSADNEACRVLAQVFPDRAIRGLPALDLIWGLGAYNCATQQEPK